MQYLENLGIIRMYFRVSFRKVSSIEGPWPQLALLAPSLVTLGVITFSLHLSFISGYLSFISKNMGTPINVPIHTINVK
jgi:hypothetical protein